MERLKLIRPADRSFAAKAQEHWDGVAKPLGSFGALEEMWDRIAAVQKTDSPDISRRAVVVMCGDNGVTAEGVTQTDSSVTLACAEAIACGRSNINALAAVYGAEVLSVDIGMEGDSTCENIINRKIAHGTGNIAMGPAMTVSQAETAVAVGMDMVKELAGKGVKLIVTGEMGIGNTTPTAALSSVILGLPPETVTGRGAGLTTEGLRRKINAVKRAIAVNSPCDGGAVQLMAKLGSFEIAGMTGLFLGGAVYGVTVIIDGVISAVSAVLASMLAPTARTICLQAMFLRSLREKCFSKGWGSEPLSTAVSGLARAQEEYCCCRFWTVRRRFTIIPTALRARG
jgi:nicotinate-nucleotide--dimethylbenzimidazole phosphoribosyltransferase